MVGNSNRHVGVFSRVRSKRAAVLLTVLASGAAGIFIAEENSAGTVVQSAENATGTIRTPGYVTRGVTRFGGVEKVKFVLHQEGGATKDATFSITDEPILPGDASHNWLQYHQLLGSGPCHVVSATEIGCGPLKEGQTKQFTISGQLMGQPTADTDTWTLKTNANQASFVELYPEL
jgi:hypothetical protein